MRNARLAVVAALVGAITMAPTELRSADALVTARAVPTATSITATTFGAVAGATSAATTAAAFALAAPATCTSNTNKSSGSHATGSTTINMQTVTGLVVGMVVTGTRIQAGTKIISIKTTATMNIVLSLATSGGTMNNNTIITGTGCQKFFNVNNTKLLNLNQFGISQSVTTTSPNSITLQRCAGSWSETEGNCTGAITDIVVTLAGTSAITTVPIALVASTGTVRLRALYTRSGVTTTISVSVRGASDLRAGITTNS